MFGIDNLVKYAIIVLGAKVVTEVVAEAIVAGVEVAKAVQEKLSSKPADKQEAAA